MTEERVVYREETSLWYRQGEEFKTPGVYASCYPEAFYILYGHGMPPPTVVRAPHREPILP
jgi:hypothetical protein